MSAGNFVRRRYQASYGAGTQIHPILVQPETTEADLGADTNSQPDDAINNPISAVISRGARAKGLKPRTITLRLLPGSPTPTGYKVGSVTRIPILTPGVFASAQEGDTVTYLSASWEIAGKTNEDAQ